MKKYYVFCAALAAQLWVAQTTVSFEAAEGFQIGTLNNQNGWEVTDDNAGNFLTNQLITTERASQGTQSFKNGYEADYDWQWFPIFGAAKSFEQPYDYKNFSISYDIFVNQKHGADFEFAAFSIEDDEYYPVAGFGLENQGYVYFIKNDDYATQYIDDAEWNLNAWNTVKLEVSEANIKYYLNDQLIYTGETFSKRPIYGINLLHNNYGGDAYYDNIRINDTTMNVSDFVKSPAVKVYPNPVVDELSIVLPSIEQLSEASLSDASGKVVAKTDAVKMDVSHLAQGVYVLKATTKSGKVHTQKIIKK